MNEFFSDKTSLKVCGITTKDDALTLINLNVDALGFNFWPSSKRFISPEEATFSQHLSGKILRVGVFVNANQQTILNLLESNIIDVAQFHGDENISYCEQFSKHGFPFIKAIGVKNANSLQDLPRYKANAILLDAHAPEVYGGTGNTFDWNLAKSVITDNPDLPFILAGGITTENAERAVSEVLPNAIDIASGAELSPGVKDFAKVTAIQNAIKSAQ